MGDKLHPSLAELKGQGWQGPAGPNRSLRCQIHTANSAPLLNLDVLDTPVATDLKTDHGVDRSRQLA
jgi:hypothetical protein